MRPLSRRATDGGQGTEVFRAVLDERNVARFWRVADTDRIPSAVRWPAIVKRDMVALAPPDHRAGFRRCLQDARDRQAVVSYTFKSIVQPNEGRRLVACPAARGGLLAVIYAIPASEAEPVPTTAVLSMAGMGMVVAACYESWWSFLWRLVA